jgi:predicted PurR-regulated permease PerM
VGAVLAIVVTILLVTSVLLVVLLVGLVRQLQVVARSLQNLGNMLTPRLAVIQREAEEAEQRMQALAELQANLAGDQPTPEAGARLRT